ncbi:MAG: TetR/AcrR family transcriptional regulator [Robiginitomaculum sp.]
MAKVKTRDRIKSTALGLFNNEGERQVGSSDIAAVMGISPGNLHYHFNAKNLIIVELFDDFEREIRQVLAAPVNEPLAIEDNWVFLYIIFEEIWDFRFFYRNMAALIERVPELAPRFSRILALLQRTLLALIGRMEASGHLVFRADEKNALSERLSMHFTYWLQYHGLRYPNAGAKTTINHGVYAALVQITPYWEGGGEGYARLISEFLDAQGE